VTALLASVRTPGEALIALEAGADILDLKEPGKGALGRLPEAAIRAILLAVGGQRRVSATIGDMPLEPGPVAAAVREMAASGVDIVKIGIFHGDLASTLEALGPLTATGLRLVAVLFADRAPNLALVSRIAAAGFYGVMLDTADKTSGSLTRHLSARRLKYFVERAHGHGLLAGLAGSLRIEDVGRIAASGADYLGFRSALTNGSRDGPIDREAVVRLRAAIAVAPRAASPEATDHVLAKSIATATAGAQSAASSATAGSAGTTAAKLL